MEIDSIGEGKYGYEEYERGGYPDQQSLFQTTDLRYDRTDIDQKVEAVARGPINNGLTPMLTSGIDASVKTEVEFSWDGKEGTTCTGSISGRADDDKGNFAEVKASQNSNGEGKASISAGHESKGDSSDNKDNTSK